MRICALLLALLFLAAGCAGPASLSSALALRISTPADGQALLDYLQDAKGNFAIIDTLLGDKDLDLLSQDTSGSDTMSNDEADKYLGLLESYNQKLSTELSGIESRAAPDNADIESFRAAEIAELQKADDIVQEYEQVLKYYKSIMAMSSDMQFGNLDTSDLEGAYKAVHNAIEKAIDDLKSANVPGFLQSTNDTFVGGLGEMDDAVLYYLQAISLDDPVRMSAANYRYDILTRKFDKIGTAFDQDITGREDKLKADLLAIQGENNGLKSWVQQNIDKLNGY
jgi:tetratricopeptide (TPR) repeat protein